MRFIHASFDLLSSFGCTGVGGCALQLEWGGGHVWNLQAQACYRQQHISSHLIVDSLCVYFNFQCLPSVGSYTFYCFQFLRVFYERIKIKTNQPGRV